MTNQKKYSQFFTPVWAAEILFNEHFSHLTDKDLVWEPSCGVGNCLSVIPQNIRAIGTEIDRDLALQAIQNTNRPVWVGDFRTITFPGWRNITAIFGNPPFDLNMFEQFMNRCENILSLGHKAGFILPAYFFQTSSTFMRFARKWEIHQEMIPRDLFQSRGLLSKPLIFSTFIRENSPQMYGFRLHAELFEIKTLNEEVKEILNNQVKRPGNIWREVLINAVKNCGGTATLDDVYKNIAGKRPTPNPFWKEQARKILQQSPFKRVDTATYQLITNKI